MVNDQTWNEGDVVQLKSGGPKMTVSAVTKTGRYECTWFDQKQVRFRAFSAVMLCEPKPVAVVG